MRRSAAEGPGDAESRGVEPSGFPEQAFDVLASKNKKRESITFFLICLLLDREQEKMPKTKQRSSFSFRMLKKAKLSHRVNHGRGAPPNIINSVA